MLSAVSPEKMPGVLQNIKRVLKVGALVPVDLSPLQLLRSIDFILFLSFYFFIFLFFLICWSKIHVTSNR